MYQTGMHVKDVLESYTEGPWNAELRYDCSRNTCTAVLQYLERSTGTRYEKTAAFTPQVSTAEDAGEQSLLTPLQLWLVLSGLERELLTEHAEALLREGLESGREEALEQTIRETIRKMECADRASV